MKLSRIKFVAIFLVLAFIFQFVSNSILGPEVRLFPGNGEWFPGAASPIGWKSTLAIILYPLKFILIGPLLFLAKEPDSPPPVLVVAFAAYWTTIALTLHYLFSTIFTRNKS